MKKVTVYAEDIVHKLSLAENFIFRPDYKSQGKGVSIIPKNTKLPSSGIHCIYRNNVPLYVGYTSNSTRERLGKFCGAVRKTLDANERHIGGERYLEAFGENFEGVTVRVVQRYAGQDISVTLRDITQEVAVILGTSFNNVNYKRNSLEFTEE